MVRETNPEPETPDADNDQGYMSRADVEALLIARDQKHAQEMAAMKSRLPVAQVAAHAGGPGYDNHQASWSKAEQELSQSGEVLDTWDIRN